MKKTYSTRISLEKISKKLGRTIRSIQRKGENLKISRPRKPFDMEKFKNRRKRANDNFYKKNKEKIYLNKLTRRRKRKREIVSLMGGKCSQCGYNKCIAALEFHHLGSKKEGHLSVIINDFSKGKALKEMRKCILLCANCHREIHQGAIG